MRWEPMVVRFWRKVDKQENGCWIWTGSRSRKLKKPYGMFRVNNILTRRAHVLSYELYYGPVSEGKEVDHICRNTMCINPEHLEAVTHGENVKRGLKAGLYERPLHCKQGHALTPDNVREEKDRWRCKICQRDAMRRHRANNKER